MQEWTMGVQWVYYDCYVNARDHSRGDPLDV